MPRDYKNKVPPPIGWVVRKVRCSRGRYYRNIVSKRNIRYFESYLEARDFAYDLSLKTSVSRRADFYFYYECARTYTYNIAAVGPSGLCSSCMKHAEDLTWFKRTWLCRDCLCPEEFTTITLVKTNWMQTAGRPREVWRSMNSDWLVDALEVAQKVVDALPFRIGKKQRRRMVNVLALEFLGTKRNRTIKQDPSDDFFLTDRKSRQGLKDVRESMVL